MLTFHADNKAVPLQSKIFKQTKVQNHKVVNSKLRIGIIIVRNFNIYIACYHMNIDANREVQRTFDKTLIIFTKS